MTSPETLIGLRRPLNSANLDLLTLRLAELAARGATTTYGALAKDLGWRVAMLTEALEALMEEDAATQAPFRAALLDARLTPGQPAPGFFDKAAALGRPLSAQDIQIERAALFAAPTKAKSAP